MVKLREDIRLDRRIQQQEQIKEQIIKTFGRWVDMENASERSVPLSCQVLLSVM